MQENHNLYARFHIRYSKTGLTRPLLVTDAGDEYRYADMESESARLARFLADTGAVPGDRISVQAAKTPQALCLYLACLRSGFVFHPLNTGYRAGELEYFFADAEPAVVVCDSGNLDLIGPLAQQLSIPHLFTLDADGSGTLADRSRDMDADPVLVRRDRDDMAALLYSSGTTGKPKGIVLTHNNLYASTRTLVRCMGFYGTRRPAARPAHLPRPRPVRGPGLRPVERRRHALAARVRCPGR